MPQAKGHQEIMGQRIEKLAAVSYDDGIKLSTLFFIQGGSLLNRMEVIVNSAIMVTGGNSWLMSLAKVSIS